MNREDQDFEANSHYQKLLFAVNSPDALFAPLDFEVDEEPSPFERVMAAIKHQEALLPLSLDFGSFDDDQLQEMIRDPKIDPDASKFARHVLGLTSAFICDEVSGDSERSETRSSLGLILEDYNSESEQDRWIRVYEELTGLRLILGSEEDNAQIDRLNAEARLRTRKIHALRTMRQEISAELSVLYPFASDRFGIALSVTTLGAMTAQLSSEDLPLGEANARYHGISAQVMGSFIGSVARRLSLLK